MSAGLAAERAAGSSQLHRRLECLGPLDEELHPLRPAAVRALQLGWPPLHQLVCLGWHLLRLAAAWALQLRVLQEPLQGLLQLHLHMCQAMRHLQLAGMLHPE